MLRSVALATGAAALMLTATAAAREPWDPHTVIRPADQKAAAAALLTVADVGPGWTGGPQAATSFKAPTCPAQQPNDGGLTITGHAESQFSNGNGGIQVTSDVEVFRS